MAAQRPDITTEQLQLLELVYEIFRQSGTWPSYLYVEQRLDQQTGADLYAVGRAIRGRLIQFDPHRSPTSQVVLPIAGISYCPGVDDDLRAFLAVLRWLIACRQDWEPTSPNDVVVPEVTSLQARAALAREGAILDDAALARVGSLARLEGLFDSCTHQPERPWEWSGTPARSLRDLRSVTSIEEYLAAHPANVVTDPVPAEEATAEERETVGGRPYIFVLMPFGEVWSDPVRDAIGRSCTDLAGEGLQLDCERADEIAKPGRITEQIIAAIRNADLIIADITESNPNVMFELGFADALGKQIIVLNQDVEAAPFDIKDWRAIAYSVRELDAAVRQLSLFIRTTLRQ